MKQGLYLVDLGRNNELTWVRQLLASRAMSDRYTIQCNAHGCPNSTDVSNVEVMHLQETEAVAFSADIDPELSLVPVVLQFAVDGQVWVNSTDYCKMYPWADV